MLLTLKSKAIAHPYITAALVCAAAAIFVPMRYGHTDYSGAILLTIIQIIGIFAAYTQVKGYLKSYFSIPYTVILVAIAAIVNYNYYTTEKPFAVISVLLFSVIAVLLFTWLVQHKLTTKRIIFLLFCAGFILRFSFILSTALSNGYQHDFFGKNGHIYYIELLYNEGLTAFPDVVTDKVNQCYHPPLHYMISALWLKIQMFFSQFFTYDTQTVSFAYNNARENLQLLTLFYSTTCMISAYKLLSLFNLKKSAIIVSFAIVAFHPSFIIIGGSCNNDMLSIAFFCASIYTAVNWYFKPTWLNILKIALTVGLGMMTKLSVVMVAPAIALIFIIKFFTSKRFLKLTAQYSAFLAVCCPLGLWWGIRNYIKSKVPINYVPLIKIDGHPQYVGKYSVWQRLFDFTIEDVWMARGTNFGYTHYEYNIAVMICKTSMFGEYYFGKASAFTTLIASILFFSNLALMLISFVSMIRFVLIKNKFLDNTLRVFFGALYLTVMGLFVKFAFDYPHDCTMDFRYITPTVIIGALFIAFALSSYEKETNNNSKKSVKSIIGSYLNKTILVLVFLFCICTAIIYL